jgi:8-oxo-dGTP diphosphatase
LDVEVKNIVAVVDRRLEGFHYVIIDYWVSLVDEHRCVPIAQSDVAEAKWISIDDLGLYDVVVGLTEIILSSYQSYIQGDLVGLYDIDLKGTDFIVPQKTENTV